MDMDYLIDVFETIKLEIMLFNESSDKKYATEYQEGMLSAYNNTVGILKAYHKTLKQKETK